MDFVRYRNHVYRVYYLSLHFAEIEAVAAVAEAAAFHDLGIWTDKTWDYLPPSIRAANDWLDVRKAGDQSELVRQIIDFHHLRGRYTGLHADWVEPFRKADWLDLSLGLRYGKASRAVYRELKNQYPIKGFHGRLLVFFFRNLIRHPLQPFPMFK
jgi:hypothetical protein